MDISIAQNTNKPIKTKNASLKVATTSALPALLSDDEEDQGVQLVSLAPLSQLLNYLLSTLKHIYNIYLSCRLIPIQTLAKRVRLILRKAMLSTQVHTFSH